MSHVRYMQYIGWFSDVEFFFFLCRNSDDKQLWVSDSVFSPCLSENPLPSTHHINWRGPESVSLGNMHNRWGAHSVVFSQACFCFFVCLQSVFDSNSYRKLADCMWQRSMFSRFLQAGEHRGQVCFSIVLYESSHDSHKQIKNECVDEVAHCFVSACVSIELDFSQVDLAF